MEDTLKDLNLKLEGIMTRPAISARKDTTAKDMVSRELMT
jgi:hypothetical protein